MDNIDETILELVHCGNLYNSEQIYTMGLANFVENTKWKKMCVVHFIRHTF